MRKRQQSKIVFDGLYVVTGEAKERSWYIDGKLEFENVDEFEDFKIELQRAFELLKGYPGVTILTKDEHTAMQQLPQLLIDE